MLSSPASIPALTWLYQSSCFLLGKVIRHSPEMLAPWTDTGIRCSIFKIGLETELFVVPGWNPGTEPSQLPFEFRHQREKQGSHWHICAVLRISGKVTLLSFPLQKQKHGLQGTGPLSVRDTSHVGAILLSPASDRSYSGFLPPQGQSCLIKCFKTPSYNVCQEGRMIMKNNN